MRIHTDAKENMPVDSPLQMRRLVNAALTLVEQDPAGVLNDLGGPDHCGLQRLREICSAPMSTKVNPVVYSIVQVPWVQSEFFIQCFHPCHHCILHKESRLDFMLSCSCEPCWFVLAFGRCGQADWRDV